MIKLYQFPISHFCEKARWALAHKKLSYVSCNLLPGSHVKKAMAIAKTSEVPILQHDDKVIQCSNKIIDYLDETFSNDPLTPIDEAKKRESLQWEAYVDKEIGPNVQRFLYHTLLKHPNILIPILAHRGPWYGMILLKFIFPKLRSAMRRGMRINDKSAAQAKVDLKVAIDKLNTQLKKQKYLAGNQFSRADLAAAALLAPLVQPEKYGVLWPSPLPQPLQETMDEWQQDLQWVTELYAQFR